MRKKLSALSVVLSLLLVVTSNARISAATKPLSQANVRIATANIGFLYAPLYVAAAKGYFTQEGLNVTLFDGGGGPNATAAVVGGGADLGAVGLGPLSRAIAHGQHLVAVANVLNNIPFVIVARSQLAKDAGIAPNSSLGQRAEVLKHRTVAVVDIGGTSELFLREALENAHVDMSMVNMVAVENNLAQLALLKAGKIDAFVNLSPISDQAIAEGYGVPLIQAANIPSMSGITFIALMAQESFVKDHADTVAALLRAERRALELEARDPKAAEAAFYQFLGTTGSKHAVPENIRHTAWVDNASDYPTSLVISPQAVDKGRKALGIPSSVSNDRLLSMSIANAVMAQPL